MARPARLEASTVFGVLSRAVLGPAKSRLRGCSRTAPGSATAPGSDRQGQGARASGTARF